MQVHILCLTEHINRVYSFTAWLFSARKTWCYLSLSHGIPSSLYLLFYFSFFFSPSLPSQRMLNVISKINWDRRRLVPGVRAKDDAYRIRISEMKGSSVKILLTLIELMLLLCFRIYSTDCRVPCTVHLCTSSSRSYENHINLMRLSRAFLFLCAQIFTSAVAADIACKIFMYTSRNCSYERAYLHAQQSLSIGWDVCAVNGEWMYFVLCRDCLFALLLGEEDGKIKFKICITAACAAASTQHMLHVPTGTLSSIILVFA